MGLLNKIFGNKTQPQTSASEPNRDAEISSVVTPFMTNLEGHGIREVTINNSGELRVDALLCIAELEKYAEENHKLFHYEVMHPMFVEAGVLTAPLVFTLNDKGYAAFFIYTEEEAKKYRDALHHLDQTDYPNAIYFTALDLLGSNETAPSTEPFQLADMRAIKDELPHDDYAMWWATEDDTTFHPSESASLLSKLYETINGYTTLMVGYLLRQVKVNPELNRINLPEETAKLLLYAPDRILVLATYDAKKGIRFLFPENATTQYRIRFLQGALVDFLAERLTLEKQGIPKDASSEDYGYGWYQNLVSSVSERETKGEKVELVGLMQFETINEED
ncbi:MAG TPA: hypothetical protein DCE41_20725 [Cytophagales bacterium]|nr:hypothetical protein [Cytophagales bacterium]HAA22293.1 hypothetical protein [Cytophagales bacterium]HAP60495.1 hypothetical protein [Cytophagales bacterium]